MKKNTLILSLLLSFAIIFNACKKDKEDENEDNTPPDPCNSITTVTDSESNSYTTVVIGTQCWLKENLKLGSMINGNTPPTDNSIIEKYCYNNEISNCNQYGGLYAWNEIMKYSNTEGAQGICPQGWRIPKKSDFEALTSQSGVNGLSLQSTVNGSGATNATNFTALLPGHRLSSGDFDYLTNKTDFWTSTEYTNNSYAYSMSLIKAGNAIDKTFFHKSLGYSVRCIKNS